jgi:ADP-heptose:LPS heptosyltransferase
VANYLKQKYNYEIVLCGGKNDIEQSKIFNTTCDFEYTDLIGKTTILELISIISRASLLISNETSAPHFSVALDVKTIVLYSGNHFGRFVPYPNSLTIEKYKCIYHPKISSDENNYIKQSNTNGYTSKLNINDISLKQVIAEIDNFFCVENINNCF